MQTTRRKRKNIFSEIKRHLVSLGIEYSEIKEGYRIIGYKSESVVRTGKSDIWEGNIGLSQRIYNEAEQCGLIYVYIKKNKRTYQIPLDDTRPRLATKGNDVIYNFEIKYLQSFTWDSWEKQK